MPRPSVRAQIVDAAYEQFHRHGYNAAGVKLITDSAGVPKGSFYNHFESKEELFDAAVDDALERHGALMDELTADLDDAAEAFAQSFRLTGRLHRAYPELSKVLISTGARLVTSKRGLTPRALRDIARGVETGRFTMVDPEIALVLAGGSALALGQLLHDHPDRDDAKATDETTEALLRTFGLTAEEAAEICARPLPDVTVPLDGSAA